MLTGTDMATLTRDVAILIVSVVVIFILVMVASAETDDRPTLQDIRDVVRDGELPVFGIAVLLTLILPHYMGYLLPGIEETWVSYGFAFGLTFTLAGIYRERTDGEFGCLYLILGGGMLVLSCLILIPVMIGIFVVGTR